MSKMRGSSGFDAGTAGGNYASEWVTGGVRDYTNKAATCGGHRVPSSEAAIRVQPPTYIPMSYTDLWRCKHCNVLPDIQMAGKNFLIACEGCGQRDSRVEADSLDQVVSKWNRLHEPAKPATGLAGKLKEWLRMVKDSLEYRRNCSRERRDRSARLKSKILRIRKGEGASQRA
jgi:hypothetical protein